MPPLMPPIISSKDRAKHAKREADRPKPTDLQQRVYEGSSRVQRLLQDFITDGATTIEQLAEACFDLRAATHALKDAGADGK